MIDPDPLWYKDAIIYQLHVRAFQDSTNDGVGDFRGLTQRLDYLQDLGVTAVWLLPFYPSPLRDDGYDIADYMAVNPSYGTLPEFQAFLDAAHKRGLRVITELVINHTSDQHPWFQRARHAPKGSPERNFYVWSDTADKYPNVPLMFPDFETSNWQWDPVAKQYYWHRFYSHQPDLNFDNPAVWDALFPVIDFWMGMGVDGMRLDAVPYLYEREGTLCEHLPETHAYLKALRKYVDERYPGRMFLAEANAWPEDMVQYFGAGDECHMAFNFPLMPRMYMALLQEDRFPILDVLEQTPPIPDTAQWCLFLRNHDEMTLAMITDEERDSMFRAYARDRRAKIFQGIRHRLAPLLGNDRRRIELMTALLFSLQGTPVIYYGDEIGMGDNIYLGDRNGVRTPMQWSPDRNAGFSRANPQRLYLPIVIDPEYSYEAVNVETQQANASSLLWWTKRLIALRKEYRAFGRGSIEFLKPENPKILAFVRRYEDETILVVANLSRFVQYAELDLKEFDGLVLAELTGRTPFPPVGQLPYLLTVGPHGILWFAVEPNVVRVRAVADRPRAEPVPVIPIRENWAELLDPSRHDWLERAVKTYLTETVVVYGQVRRVRDVVIRAAAKVPIDEATAFLLADVDFLNGETQLRAIRLRYAGPGDAADIPAGAVVAELTRGAVPAGVLHDGRTDPGFTEAILRGIAGGRTFWLDGRKVVAEHYPRFAEVRGPDEVPGPITFRRGDQHDATALFGDRLVLKSFERLEPGVHPAVEVGRFLAEKTSFRNTPPVVGSVELRSPDSAEATTMAVLFGHVANEGLAWRHALDVLSRFYEGVLAHPMKPPAPAPRDAWTPGVAYQPPAEFHDLLDAYLPAADRIGRVTADLHRAFLSADDAGLSPEPFGKQYQRSVYQGLRNRVGVVFRTLAQELPELPDETRRLAVTALGLEQSLTRRHRAVLSAEVTGVRIRIHGNYHLGELLHTGSDFVVTDFEGDPDRPLTERRIKRSPLRDIADMVRSFHYAALSPLYGAESGKGTLPGRVREEDRAELFGWARFWATWVSARFVQSYYAGVAGAELLPGSPDVCRELLELMVLDRAVLELGRELAHRPDWVPVPLTGLIDMMS